MKQANIKQVKEHLSLYGIPQAKLIMVEEGREPVQITSSGHAKEVFEKVMDPQTSQVHETFFVMYLNRKNAVQKAIRMFEGGINGTVVDVRMILAGALISLSSSIIVAHNHPSGNTTPSGADIAISKKIRDSAKLMDIDLLDSLILTPSGDYYSMADELVI